MTKPDRATRAAETIIERVVGSSYGGSSGEAELRKRLADIIRAEYQVAEELAEYIKLYQDEPPNTVGWRQLRDLARRFLMED